MKKIISFLLISATFLCSLTFIVYGREKNCKIGIGIYANVTADDADGEASGKASTEYTFAAIVIDDDGRVLDCELDASAKGAVSVSSDGDVSIAEQMTTKVTLGDSYGMSMDAQTTEWYIQADKFENTVRGKTLDEIKNLVVTSGENAGKGNEDVINAGCTIYISEFVLAIEKAFSNTKSVKLSNPDIKLGVAVSSSATNPDGETNGSASFTAVVNAAVANDGKMISCLTDELTIDLKVTSSGNVEGKSESYKTKRELGENYGMSASGKTEWYVQVDAFDKACEGKTADEILSLVLNGNEEIQKAGCTIYAGTLAKAAADAVD